MAHRLLYTLDVFEEEAGNLIGYAQVFDAEGNAAPVVTIAGPDAARVLGPYEMVPKPELRRIPEARCTAERVNYPRGPLAGVGAVTPSAPILCELAAGHARWSDHTGRDAQGVRHVWSALPERRLPETWQRKDAAA